jgi:hypothetical protein
MDSGFGRAVSRILSTPVARGRESFISAASTRDPACAVGRAAPGSPIWPCSRWGFPCPRDYSRSGGLLPRLFTLTPIRTLQRGAGRSVFCGTIRRCALRRPSRVYPSATLRPAGLRGIAPCGVRTFLPGPLPARSDSPPFQNRGERRRECREQQAASLAAASLARQGRAAICAWLIFSCAGRVFVNGTSIGSVGKAAGRGVSLFTHAAGTAVPL